MMLCLGNDIIQEDGVCEHIYPATAPPLRSKPEEVQKRRPGSQTMSKTKRRKAEEVQKREGRTEDKVNPNGGLRKTKVVHRYGSKNRPAEDKGRPKTKSLRQGTVATHKSIMQLQDLKMP